MIEAILPADVAAADTFDELPDEPLFPQEEAAVAKAVDKRQREFRTVRGCARTALAQLGMVRPVLVPGTSGAASWPDGIVGSMTHCAGYRAAAVARAVDVLSLGIDAEPHAALPGGVLDSVALPSEQAQLAELRRTAGGVCWDRLLFSGKESVYKAWYPDDRPLARLRGRTGHHRSGAGHLHRAPAGGRAGRRGQGAHGLPRPLARPGWSGGHRGDRPPVTGDLTRSGAKQRRDVLIGTLDPSTPLTDTSQRGRW